MRRVEAAAMAAGAGIAVVAGGIYHVISKKIEEAQSRNFEAAAGILSKTEGETVEGLVKEHLLANINLDYDADGVRVHALQEEFDKLVPGCLLVPVTKEKERFSVGVGEHAGYKAVKIRNPISNKKDQEGDTFRFQENLFELEDKYHQDHPTMKTSEAEVIILDNCVYLLMMLLDEAKKIPGNDGQNALEIIGTNIIALMENFQKKIAPIRKIPLLNHFGKHRKTGRWELCDAAFDPVTQYIERAKKQQNTNSLQYYARILKDTSERLSTDMEIFISHHYCGKNKEDVNIVMEKWKNWRIAHDTHVETKDEKTIDAVFVNAQMSVHNLLMFMTNETMTFSAAGMVLARRAKKTIEKYGENFTSLNKKTDFILSLLFMHGFYTAAFKKFAQLIPKPDAKETTIPCAIINFEPHCILLPQKEKNNFLKIKEKLFRIDTEFGEIKKLMAEMIKRVIFETPEFLPDPCMTASIAYACIENDILKETLYANLQGCDRRLVDKTITLIDQQIDCYKLLREKNLFGSSGKDRLLQTESDFSKIILELSERKKDNLRIIVELEKTKNTLFCISSPSTILQEFEEDIEELAAIREKPLVIDNDKLLQCQREHGNRRYRKTYFIAPNDDNTSVQYLLSKNILSVDSKSDKHGLKIHFERLQQRDDFDQLLHVLTLQVPPKDAALNSAAITTLRDYRNSIFFLNFHEKKVFDVIKQLNPTFDFSQMKTCQDIINLRNDKNEVFGHNVFNVIVKRGKKLDELYHQPRKKIASVKTVKQIIASITPAETKNLFSGMQFITGDFDKYEESLLPLLVKEVITFDTLKHYVIHFEKVLKDIDAINLANFLMKKRETMFRNMDRAEQIMSERENEVLDALTKLNALSEDEVKTFQDAHTLLDNLNTIINIPNVELISDNHVRLLLTLNEAFKQKINPILQKLSDNNDHDKRKAESFAKKMYITQHSAESVIKWRRAYFDKFKNDIISVLIQVINDIKKFRNGYSFYTLFRSKEKRLIKMVTVMKSSDNLAEFKVGYLKFFTIAEKHQGAYQKKCQDTASIQSLSAAMDKEKNLDIKGFFSGVYSPASAP